MAKGTELKYGQEALLECQITKSPMFSNEVIINFRDFNGNEIQGIFEKHNIEDGKLRIIIIGIDPKNRGRIHIQSPSNANGSGFLNQGSAIVSRQFIHTK